MKPKKRRTMRSKILILAGAFLAISMLCSNPDCSYVKIDEKGAAKLIRKARKTMQKVLNNIGNFIDNLTE